MLDNCKVEGCTNKVHARGNCAKHNLQIKRHGKILERTKYTPNEIIIKIGYAEMAMYNKNQEETGRVLIDIEDIEKIKINKWCEDGNGYVMRVFNKKTVLLHRELMECPKGKEVDHINGDRLDNRKNNLRICTHQQNAANICIRSDNKSGITGVIFHKGVWKSNICINGKTKHIGCFKTKEEAIQKRLVASLNQYGEFASELRFINE